MRRFLILAPVLLAACSPTGRELPLQSVDFRNPAEVAQIREQLSLDDQEAFSNYVLWHNPASSGFCGDPLVDEDGYPPYSIADAIRLTRMRDEEARLARVEASTEPDFVVEQRGLITRKDTLIDQQSLMRARYGNGVMESAEWKALDAQIAEINARLAELES